MGEYSVVKPDPGVTTDQVLYYYAMPGQPVVYIRRSNLVPEGETVLSTAEPVRWVPPSTPSTATSTR